MGLGSAFAMESVLVFVVEDDELIQALIADTLEEAGFGVAITSSAEKAIRMLDAPDAPCRALVTDINLQPGTLTGWDVARHARQQQPELPVIYMTGGSANEWASLGVPNSILIQKPFVPAQVITAISQLLNSVPPPADRSPH